MNQEKGLTCADVMVPPDSQLRIDPDESIATAFRLIRDKRVRFLPAVHADGRYAGVFSAPTLLRLILPRAATIGLTSEGRLPLDHLGFMSLSRSDFTEQLERLKDEKVADNLSNPANIPVAAPSTPIMEGIFLIHKFKRHLMLVEPESGRFVGSVSPNSLLDNVLGQDSA